MGLPELSVQMNAKNFLLKCPNLLPFHSPKVSILMGTVYYKVNEKYKNYYFVLALVTWSKMPVILSMHETEKEAQEELRLLALEVNK